MAITEPISSGANEMKIRDLFDKSKNIDRRIEKVITYGAADVNSLRQEITEYIVTDSIERNFEKLLDLLDTGMEGGWNQEIGVWVSGFYGSGKSSFTKYLGFALSSEISIDDKPFIEWLKNQFKSLPLKQRLTTVAMKHPATVIMLDLASEQLAGATMAEISSVLFYKVMQWAGYSRDKKISQLEFKLEEDGKMDLFKNRILELTKGIKWEEIHNRPLESKTYASRLAPEFYPESWPDSKSFNEIVIDEAEAVAKRIEQMISLIKRRSNKENIVFILDEVGQYIAARDDLITNLQGLAESMRMGQGHVWLMATAQQTLTEDDPRAQLNTAKLFKLQNRFPISVDLEASDIKEICYRRLLSKSKEGDAFLQTLFDSNGQSLRLFTKLVNTRYYSSADLDKKIFCDLYPFLPQHFDILLELLGRLAKTSGGIGLRSAIKVIQDILVDKSGLRPGETLVADKDARILVTTATFYDTLRVDLQKSFRHIVSGVEKVEKIFGPDSVQAQAAKSIAVLQVLEDFPVNRENLAAVMHPSVDSASLASDVSKAVDEMLKEPSIPLNEIDGSLRFMSEKVLELEQEKMKLVIRPADTRNVFHTKLREIFTPAPISYLNGSRVVTSGVKALSGSMQIPLVGEKDVIQTLIEFIPDSKYEVKKNEAIKDSLQNSYRNTILLLGREDSGIENLLDEICRCVGIYFQHHNKKAEKEVGDYVNGQLQRADTLKTELESLLLKSLAGGSFIFKGKEEAVKTLENDCREAAKKYLRTVAAEVFEKYSEAPVQVESNLAERFLKADRIDKIASKDDPLELIKKAGATVSINTQHKAIVSIKDYLERLGQVEGRKLLEDFYAPPYGWSKDTTRYLIAAMLIAGEIKLRISGEDITVPGDVAIDGIKNTNSFNKIGIGLRARASKPDPNTVLRAAERLLKLTGEEVLPLEQEISKSVIKHFPDFQQDYAPLAVRLGNLGLSGIEKAQSIQEGIAEILKGDASDATNRLGAADCPFYENLLWAQEVKKAFDNKIDSVIRKANQYVSDLPKLPNLGITGQLIDDTLQDRETLSDRKGRDDFYNQIIDMQNCVSSIETRIKSAAADLLIEEDEYKSSEVKKLQWLPEWKQLGEDDRNWFQSEIDRIQITASDGLGGLQQLLNIHYVLEKELKRLEQEILERAKRAGKKGEEEKSTGGDGDGVFDADFSSLPSEISSAKELDDIIQSLAALKEKLNIFKKIRIFWR